MTSVHFSSARMDWQTPKAVYDALNEEFGFTHDPCPVVSDDEFWRVDGLSSDWGDVNFCNPPYGTEIGKWVKKAWQEWRAGRTCVLLIPSRTDTAWWHDYIMQATEIRFVRGRLKFGDAVNAAPFPSAIVVFKANPQVTGIDINHTSRHNGGMTTFRIGDRVRVRPHGGRTDNKVGVVHATVAHRNLDIHFDDGDGGCFAQDDLEAE